MEAHFFSSQASSTPTSSSSGSSTTRSATGGSTYTGGRRRHREASLQGSSRGQDARASLSRPVLDQLQDQEHTLSVRERRVGTLSTSPPPRRAPGPMSWWRVLS